MDKKNTIKIIVVILCVIVAGILFCFAKKTKEQSAVTIQKTTESKQQDEKTSVKEEQKRQIYIHVCGEVLKPGVYCLSEGARVCDAIAIAGGLTKKAAGETLNQAKAVTDGEQLYIPSKKEMKGETKLKTDTSSSNSTETAGDLVNINSAGMDQLTTLTGIGESRAKLIIDYREKNNGFKKIEDIMNVQGIKEGIYNKIKDKITV